MARSRLTLRQRQALRRGEKIYDRHGQEIDKNGMPVYQEEPPSDVGDDGQYLPPGVTAVPSAEKEAADYKAEQERAAREERDRQQSLITQTQEDNPNPVHEPSQAEKDYYASFDAEGNPTDATTITQEHLNEIGMGEGGEGFTVDDIGPGQEPNPDEIPGEMPGFTSEHNAYIDPMTGEKQFQTREEWSASIGEDEKYSKGRGFTAPEGGKVKSGTLRRNIRKMAPSLISGSRTS